MRLPPMQRAVHGAGSCTPLVEEIEPLALGSERPQWADSAPRETASGMTEVCAIAVLPLRVRNRLRRAKRKTLPRIEGRLRPNRNRSFFRHPCLAQAVVHPLAHPSREPVLGLDVRLPCRDRLERPGGGQREVALQRLARFRIMIALTCAFLPYREPTVKVC
jgi:hypothetical protein